MELKNNSWMTHSLDSQSLLSTVLNKIKTTELWDLLPYVDYIGTGMCGPRGYGFSAILVINRV